MTTPDERHPTHVEGPALPHHLGPAAELAAAVGVALTVPQGRPGSIAHGPVRERLWQALKAWRSQQ